jgi:hypothetical protein
VTKSDVTMGKKKVDKTKCCVHGCHTRRAKDRETSFHYFRSADCQNSSALAVVEIANWSLFSLELDPNTHAQNDVSDGDVRSASIRSN